MLQLEVDPNTRMEQLNRSARRLKIVSLMIIVVIFGAGGTWLATAKLDSAAIAPGFIVVESKSKTIQHLEGGIVREILVSDGDKVTADQVLLRLDDTRAKANLDLYKGHYYTALALENRLRAERDKSDAIDFGDDLRANQDDSRVAEAMQGETGIFEARRTALAGQEAILKQKIEQLKEEIIGLNAQQKSGKRQLALIREEIKDQEQLKEKGHARKPRILALKRHAAELQGRRGEFLARIARAKQSIAEAKLAILDLNNRHLSQVVAELRQAESQVAELAERIRASTDILERTEIRAPQNGVVADLQIHTPGGVIAPGEDILDLVPENDDLIVEAQVRPEDIDVVHLGLLAQVQLTAFNRRTTPAVDGKLIYLAADRSVDQKSGLAYYKALIEVDPKSLAELDHVKLYPGMPATAFIATGSRVAIDYFIAPVTDSLNKVFRDD